jgi:membrane-bound ClpP family serine protease
MPNLKGNSMSWTDWTLLCLFIVGFLLFLVGANTYNAVVGYSGVYIFIGSIAAYLIIYIYKELTNKKPVQNP